MTDQPGPPRAQVGFIPIPFASPALKAAAELRAAPGEKTYPRTFDELQASEVEVDPYPCPACAVNILTERYAEEVAFTVICAECQDRGIELAEAADEELADALRALERRFDLDDRILPVGWRWVPGEREAAEREAAAFKMDDHSTHGTHAAAGCPECPYDDLSNPDGVVP